MGTFQIHMGEDEVGGSVQLVLDNLNAIYLKKHVYMDYMKSFDEVEFIDHTTGATNLQRYERDNQLWGIGICANEGEHAELKIESEGEDYYFVAYIVDNGQNVTKKIGLDFLRSDFSDIVIPTKIVFDKDSNMHFYVSTANDGMYYYVVSSNGEVAYRNKMVNKHILDITLWNDGSAALLVDSQETGKSYETLKYEFIRYRDNDFESIFSYEIAGFSGPFSLYVEDEKTTIIADLSGIYYGDEKLENKRPIYTWMNHGIHVDSIIAVKKQGIGIGVIYQKGQEFHYVHIEPVVEETEMNIITIAVSTGTKELYKEAIIDFNKKYPAYNIQIEEYNPNDTRLLTQINAGDGPVLIDTTLTGFDDKKKLWEPLDHILEKMEILEALNKEALECGKIDGHIYGVTTDFFLNTLVLSNDVYADWNYQIAMKAFNDDNYEYIIDSKSGENYHTRVITEFFIHGFDDNLLIDDESGMTYFLEDDFKQLVRVVKEKVPSDAGTEPNNAKILCNSISISRPKDLFAYMSIYGSDATFSGYPHKDGAYSLISSRMPLTIRKNATKEEKEIACAFIKTLLSYESQVEMAGSPDFGFSVRNDVLEEQFNDVDTNQPAYISGFGNVRIQSDLTSNQVSELFKRILSKSKARKTFPAELNSIIREELTDYFNGIISVEEMCKRLDSRVKIYLAERAD